MNHQVEAVQAISMLHNQEYFDKIITVRLLRANDPDNLVTLAVVAAVPRGLKTIGKGLGLDGLPLTTIPQGKQASGTSKPAIPPPPVLAVKQQTESTSKPSEDLEVMTRRARQIASRFTDLRSSEKRPMSQYRQESNNKKQDTGSRWDTNKKPAHEKSASDSKRIDERQMGYNGRDMPPRDMENNFSSNIGGLNSTVQDGPFRNSTDYGHMSSYRGRNNPSSRNDSSSYDSWRDDSMSKNNSRNTEKFDESYNNWENEDEREMWKSDNRSSMRGRGGINHRGTGRGGRQQAPRGGSGRGSTDLSARGRGGRPSGGRGSAGGIFPNSTRGGGFGSSSSSQKRDDGGDGGGSYKANKRDYHNPGPSQSGNSTTSTVGREVILANVSTLLLIY